MDEFSEESIEIKNIVKLQNEFLIAKVDDKPVAMVPDLICLVDLETAEPITAEAVKYGQRVHVIGVSVPDNMRTKQALDTFGPVPFKVYDKYIPIEEISWILLIKSLQYEYKYI